MTRNKSLVFIALFLLFCGMAFQYSQRAFPRKCSDFRVNYETAKRFILKQDLYEKFEDATVANFKYSPMFAMLVSPLAVFSLNQAALIFFSLNFASLLVIFICFKRLIVEKATTSRENLLLYVLSFIFVFRFIISVLHEGQINILMIAFVAIALYSLKKGKDVLAGAFLGLAIL